MNSSKVTSNVYEILIIKNVYAKIPIMFFDLPVKIIQII